jgi:two-component system chemotaxis response regulator CheY
MQKEINLTDLKILIVDDSPTMRRIIINTLKRVGYTDMTEATDGKDALVTMKEKPFDLVITDWNMPEMDGVTLASILKRSRDYRHIPVLMVTTRSVQEDIVAAISAGVNGYIVKPFSPEILKEKIDQVTGHLEGDGHDM